MTNGEHAKQIDAFDPLGSIFLPRTRNPGAEFSLWQAQILLRRGVAAGARAVLTAPSGPSGKAHEEAAAGSPGPIVLSGTGEPHGTKEPQ